MKKITDLVAIESLGDADMRPREIPETHGTRFNGESEGEVSTRIVVQDMGDVVQQLVLVLEHANQ